MQPLPGGSTARLRRRLLRGRARRAAPGARVSGPLPRGALNAGSDPLDAGPPSAAARAQLLQRFQESTRIVYLTGEHDTLAPNMDADSLRLAASLVRLRRRSRGHARSRRTRSRRRRFRPGAARAARIPAAPPPAKLAACRAAIDGEAAAQLARGGSRSSPAGERARGAEAPDRDRPPLRRRSRAAEPRARVGARRGSCPRR